jgi:hypothetical protein
MVLHHINSEMAPYQFAIAFDNRIKQSQAHHVSKL